MDQIGFVKSITGDKVEVEVTRISGCGENCGSCSGCDMGHSLLLKNNINAKVGDKVLITGETKDILKYTILVYIFPLASLILGIVAGSQYLKPRGVENHELFGFGLGIILMAISYFIVRKYDDKLESKDDDAIKITEILEQE